MTTPNEVKRLVEWFRSRVHSVLEVAEEDDRTDSAPGHRPRGVWVCGDERNNGLRCQHTGKEIRKA